jgi:hypothetical protein
MNPRLLRLLAIVSDHFGGRTIHVISAFRPFRRGQYTAHSKHNIGNAVDFRVEGVPNRVVRDFCTTLPNTGCGYYPRSVFVHMDVRPESVTWVDWSGPGQRPMYGSMSGPPPTRSHGSSHGASRGGSSSNADESVDDVADENTSVRTSTRTPDPDDGPAPAGSSSED